VLGVVLVGAKSPMSAYYYGGQYGYSHPPRWSIWRGRRRGRREVISATTRPARAAQVYRDPPSLEFGAGGGPTANGSAQAGSRKGGQRNEAVADALAAPSTRRAESRPGPAATPGQ